LTAGREHVADVLRELAAQPAVVRELTKGPVASGSSAVTRTSPKGDRVPCTHLVAPGRHTSKGPPQRSAPSFTAIRLACT
jgi:hypothetical protein